MEVEKILNDGFLDEELNVAVKQIRNKNKEAYSLAKEINELMYTIEKSFEKDNANNRDIYVCTLFTQIHISCQTYLLLIERGLYGDSQVILRSIYEKIFNMAMVIRDESYLKRLLKKALSENLSALENIKKHGYFGLVSEKVINEEIEQYRKALNGMEDIKATLNTAQLANKINMDRQYIYYKLLSKYTHAELTVLLQQLIFKEEGIIINGGRLEEEMLPGEILRFIECAELIIRAIDEYKEETNNIKKLQNIQLKYEYLWKEYK